MSENKTAASGEKPERKRDPLVQAIARAMSRDDFKQKNPKGSVEQRKAHWVESRSSYMNTARKIARTLTKAGFTITPPAASKDD